MQKKVYIKTFGCQMNEYDSNRIYDSVKKINYIKTNNQGEADCYILNTCHIRDKAKENLITVITRHVIIESGINKSEKYSLFERDCELYM